MGEPSLIQVLEQKFWETEQAVFELLINFLKNYKKTPDFIHIKTSPELHHCGHTNIKISKRRTLICKVIKKK